MKEQKLTLKPFAPNSLIPDLTISVDLLRSSDRLSLQYNLSGELDQILLPKSQPQVSRKDELWQTTCFEFFLAVFNAPEYWEFNLAPTGDWNVYAFAKYRRGMRPELRFSSLPIQVIQAKNSYSVEVAIALNSLVSSTSPLELAVTTVIEDISGNISYWAITHPGTEADFHRRDSFITI